MAARTLLSVFLLVPALSASAQALPPVPTLIQDVQAHQQQLDKTRESYTFREQQIMHELDKHGGVKKQETREYNVFFVNGHPIQRLVRKNGASLNPGEEAKETEHIKNKIDQAEHTPPGDLLNSKHTVSVSRMLVIEHFTNERRVTMDNRPMIALDFTGDRKAQTHGIAEDASKHLSGTVWIDEHDHEVRRVQATLDSPFQKIINNEVWLPTGASIHIEARAALFLGYHVQVEIIDDQYRRFHTAAEQQDAASGKP